MPRILSVFLLFFSSVLMAQVNKNDTIRVENHPKDSVRAGNSNVSVLEDITESNAPAQIQRYNPTKAGLYSAALPGLGQYYNRKFWKIPVVWGALGTGIGVTIWYDKQYKRYRNAYIAELNGQPHEFSDIANVDKVVLGNTQDRVKRQRDYAIAATAAVYILNIVDAVVDAHLYEQKQDPDLAVRPSVVGNPYGRPGFGFAFNYTLK